MRLRHLAFLVALGMAGCISRVEPERVSIGEMATADFPSKVNFLSQRKFMWRQVSGEIEKAVVKAAYEKALPLTMTFSNCRWRSLGKDDIYVNGVSLYQMRMTDEEFLAFYEALSDPVVFTSRIRESEFSGADSVCARIYGANMAAQGVRSPNIRLK